MKALLQLRRRLGAKGMVVLLLLAPLGFGVWHFGPRAGLVVGLSVLVCVAASVIPRLGEPQRWLNPGTLVTGLLLGLTLSATTPLYMVVVGALCAELLGKRPLGLLGRNPLNPALVGRGAVAVLEFVDPPLRADTLSAASVLFKDAGGYATPSLLEAFVGLTGGAIGETSFLALGLVAVPMLALVVVKREAPVAMLITVPLMVALLPPTAAISGHAPWVLNPVYYLTGSAALLYALFFATDPVTTPKTRFGGVLFGVGAGAIGVLGRLYTEIPGAEMYGILAMNALTPALDRWAGVPRKAPAPGFYAEIPPAPGRVEQLPEGPGLRLIAGPPAPDLPAEEILERVERSGLGGCGGAWFPVAAKWRAALEHSGPRYLVVNAQEGEPDSIKDRYLLQHHAERLAEGVAIAARVLQPTRIFAVLDPAFPASRLEEALSAREDLPAWEVREGPGLYVAGEETALIAWLEGRPAEPSPRPPYPTERGLFGRPTVVHNAETLTWLPSVLARGASWFEPGWKLVTVSGVVRRPGLYEVRLGTRLEELVALAGGATEALLGFAVGGPSGGLLPASAAGLPLEARALAEAGAQLGTGTVRVLGETSCVVEEARRAAAFFTAESCGRCTPCRVGTGELLRTWRSPSPEGLQRMTEVDRALGASICGLGTGAAALGRSVLRYWPEAVRAHGLTERCERCRESS